MTAIENECLDGGLIVGMEDQIPEDASSLYTAQGKWIGCNRIFCSVCRSWVRHLDGVRIWKSQPGPDEMKQLYADENASRSPLLTNGAGGDLRRTYLCRCSWADIAGVKPIPYVDGVDGWYCAGHPSP
jgi:hypothetical protein